MKILPNRIVGAVLLLSLVFALSLGTAAGQRVVPVASVATQITGNYLMSGYGFTNYLVFGMSKGCFSFLSDGYTCGLDIIVGRNPTVIRATGQVLADNGLSLESYHAKDPVIFKALGSELARISYQGFSMKDVFADPDPPAVGGILYVRDGVLWYVSAGGVRTMLAPAASLRRPTSPPGRILDR